VATFHELSAYAEELLSCPAAEFVPAFKALDYANARWSIARVEGSDDARCSGEGAMYSS
jgi:hypothetical protein